jgi:hypothetical protein
VLELIRVSLSACSARSIFKYVLPSSQLQERQLKGNVNRLLACDQGKFDNLQF